MRFRFIFRSLAFVLAWLWLAVLPALGRAGAGGEPPPADTAAWRRALLAQPPPPDTARLRLLFGLTHALREEQPSRALGYGHVAVELARHLGRPANATRLNALLDLAAAYANLSEGPAALTLLREAEPLAQALHNPDAVVRTLGLRAGIYHERRDTAVAWLYYRQALQGAAQPGVSLHTRMRMLSNASGLLFYNQKRALALRYANQALLLARQLGDRAAESSCLATLGSYELNLGHPKAAERLQRQALALSTAAHSSRLMATNLVLLGLIDDQQGHYAAEAANARRALALARHAGFRERALDAYSLLSTASANLNNYKAAYGWDQAYLALSDSLNDSQLLQALAVHKTTSEARGREQRIGQLVREKSTQARHTTQLLSAVAVLGLALALSGWFYYKLRRSGKALELASARLHEQTQAKDQLYAIVAHDLRGPVTSFTGVAALIDAYTAKGNVAALNRLADLVRSTAHSLGLLLENVLSWAASQSGTLTPKPERLAVAELLQECIGLYQAPADAVQVRLSAAAPPGLHLLADRNMARTILRNLVGNALKYTPPGGTVRLGGQALAGTPGWVVLTCQDSGAGIAPPMLAALRAGTTLLPASGDPVRQGTGLGLVVTAAFARQLGGQLSIESTVGVGTEVRVQLPVG